MSTNAEIKRERVIEKRKKARTRSLLLWGSIAVLVIGVLGIALYLNVRPAVGQDAEVMADNSHAAEGEDPGPYNTDPPTSGRHYASEFEAGFYDEDSPEAQKPFPDGYLVHNLEHGYVIFWYNCDLLDEGGCQELKTQINAVMDEVDNFKVIAFPRDSINVPVVLTSWGQLQEFDRFSPEEAQAFVERNRNHAPEPNAP